MADDPERAKLDALSERIRQAEAGLERPRKDVKASGDGVGGLGRAGFDFAGSLIGGGLLGYALDSMFPMLAPWGMVGLVLAGFVAGMVGLWRFLEAPQDKKPER